MFDPVRSYDKPGVILAQLANGIATTDSVRRVLFDPAALSPRERESFADKMKQAHGGNAVADTAIDVLTNPLVWLGVLTSVGGGVAANNLAKGNRFFGAPSGAGSHVGAAISASAMPGAYAHECCRMIARCALHHASKLQSERRFAYLALDFHAALLPLEVARHACWGLQQCVGGV